MRKLIIAPHVDDDVLGCGGILDENCFVLYCGLDETGIPNRPSEQERKEEIHSVINITHHNYRILDNLVNHYNEQQLIGQIEKEINILKPDEVYVCNPSYNQDHRAVYDATMVALRPHDKNHFVKRVLLYEQPQVYFWNTTDREFNA